MSESFKYDVLYEFEAVAFEDEAYHAALSMLKTSVGPDECEVIMKTFDRAEKSVMLTVLTDTDPDDLTQAAAVYRVGA